MRATPLAVPKGVPSRKKQLDSDDDLDTERPTRKQALSGPQPRLPPCPLPPSPPRAPVCAPAVTAASRLGPYVLLEPEEGSRTYRALHCPTSTEYICKVYPACEALAVLEPYSRLPRHGHVARPAEVLVGPQHLTKVVLENLEDACVLTGSDDSLCDKHACPAYVGPEILSSRASYSGKAADVWSLGVALFTMLAGHYPFQDSEPILLFGKIRRGAFALPEGLSAPARCLVRCLLRREPTERLTASGILLHPWLRENVIPPAPTRSHLWEADQVVPEGPGLEEVEEEGERDVGLYG
ncbi:Tribbles-like protein 3 [Camelus dromedarius]|uniref:Tribbles-like protein 3 n=1 Tax=Camelus dromedarius TaxID=9838 RepID=A0A5N4CVK5_CAMDR|nr:Tribbles-like protein 3 [Camelus dromedarius]